MDVESKTSRLLQAFIEKLKESPDGISTALSIIGGYIVTQNIKLSWLIQKVKVMTIDDWWMWGWYLVILLIGYGAYKRKK